MKTLRNIAVTLLAATALTTFAAPAIAAPAGVEKLAAASPDATVSFEIFLPLRNEAELDALIASQLDPKSSQFEHWLTPDEFAARFGPTGDSLTRAQAAAKAAGLTITRTGTRSFHVTATVAQVAKAFSTTFKTAPTPSGHMRFVAGKLTIPAALQAEGATIFAFTGLPLKQPNVVLKDAKPLTSPANRYGTDGPYWYNDLKQAYDYPSYQSKLPNGQTLDGTGVRVAVLMSDLLYPGDVAAYFNHEHFSTTTGKPAPSVTTVTVDGGGVVNGNGSLEATLDVEQVLGGSPGATVTLVSIPDLSDDSITDGYQYIVDQNKYDVVNSSFGGCELLYTAAYNSGEDFTYILKNYDQIFKQGVAQGITFVASSGDEGGLSCPTVAYFYGAAKQTFVKSVQFPSDSPNVTGVGGTNLVTVSDGTLNSAYFSENGQGDPEVPYDPYGVGVTLSGGYWGPGGGISAVFAKPSYQSQVNTGSSTYRTIPDIGMQVGGCPTSAIQPCGPDRSSVIVTFGVNNGGGNYSVIGTSVSSPEFVGAYAMLVQKNGKRIGNVNTYLYQLGAKQTAAGGTKAPAASQFFHRNIPGYDGVYHDTTPTVNYNYIVGNGTPDVRKLFSFTNFAAAGLPQTPSNP